MFKCTGILEYSENPYKLIVKVPFDIVNYYHFQISQWAHVDLNRQRYAPHISVVRKEIPKNLSVWRKYHGKRVGFEYDHVVYNDQTYFWLNAFSSDLETVRNELGLTRVSKLTQSPDGKHRFHITIGNLKPNE